MLEWFIVVGVVTVLFLAVSAAWNVSHMGRGDLGDPLPCDVYQDTTLKNIPARCVEYFLTGAKPN